MAKYIIKNRYTDKIIVAMEAERFRDVVEAHKMSLRDASLSKIDIWGADLKHANLEGADLRGSYFRSCDLREANLRKTDLRGADFQRADLRNSDMTDVLLDWTNLRAADLTGVKTNKQDEILKCLKIVERP